MTETSISVDSTTATWASRTSRITPSTTGPPSLTPDHTPSYYKPPRIAPSTSRLSSVRLTSDLPSVAVTLNMSTRRTLVSVPQPSLIVWELVVGGRGLMVTDPRRTCTGSSWHNQPEVVGGVESTWMTEWSESAATCMARRSVRHAAAADPQSNSSLPRSDRNISVVLAAPIHTTQSSQVVEKALA